MAKMPTVNPFSTAYQLNMVNAPEQRRSQRMGMATLGEKCARKMWFKFRWAAINPLNKRIKRIFDFGDACEKIVIQELINIGIEITDQQKPVPGWAGHIFGFIDGIAHNVYEAPKTPHLLEVKSMNDRQFEELKKKLVKVAKPEHYAQMTAYMGKLDLTRALYVVINKNTSEIYVERIEFDKEYYRELMTRAMDVISHETAPLNTIQDANNYACRFCDFKNVCYDNEPLLKSCRSCEFADIEDDGVWSCRVLVKKLTLEDQIKGCENYRTL